jgi:phage tail P2-like protein
MADSTTALDLSRLPPPMVVEQLSYEAIRAAIVDQLVAELPAFDATVTSDPAVKVLEVVAYREMLIRQQFNERARQVMLAYATGSNLDQLGALLDVGRLAGEADTAYRARIQLAPEAFSVAGPASAYRFYALSAAPTIADASVAAPRPDDIRAVVMGCLAAQGAGADLVAAMEAALDAMVWPGTVIISLLSSLGDGSASAAEIEAVEMAVAERGRAPADRLAQGRLGQHRALRDRHRPDHLHRPRRDRGAGRRAAGGRGLSRRGAQAGPVDHPRRAVRRGDGQRGSQRGDQPAPGGCADHPPAGGRMSGRGGADCRPCRLIACSRPMPPRSKPGWRGLASGCRRWNCRLPTCGTRRPARCPRCWLAWTLSVDTWDTDWTEERKRAITAGAIAAQRRKGSVAVVREALRTIDERLELVEADPAVSPCLYRAPAGAGP